MDRKGSILIISLWILAILVVFSIGIGHRASINLRLTRYQRDSLKANLLASAGINKAIALAELDSTDVATRDYDTINECAVNLNGKDPKEIFTSNWNKAAESFVVGYKNLDESFIYGAEDETGRVYINGSDTFTKNKIFALLDSEKIEDANDLSGFIADWTNPKSQIVLAKKEKLIRPEELLLALEDFYKVRGGDSSTEAQRKTQETYSKIKNLFTIYGDGKLNINAASSKTINILSVAIAKENKQRPEAALNLASKLLELREAGTIKDANNIVIATTGAEEDNIFNAIKQYLTVSSNIFRIESTGAARNINKKATAVYDRTQKKIIYWRQN